MTTRELQEPRIQFYPAPIRNTAVKAEVSIKDVYLYITHTSLCDPLKDLILKHGPLNGDAGGIQQATQTLRSITNEQQHRKYKGEHFAFALFSGLFNARKDSGLIQHSGLICIDFDHLGDRKTEVSQMLINDPHFETELLFTSPSGDGLKWVVEIDLARCDHRTWFAAISSYVRQQYHLETDRSGANESRACFLPYDPNCYINPLTFNSYGRDLSKRKT